ncbi:MOSC domain-containing protein [Micromonospora sp. GCM10011542]|uniref:MOSC domain-containing protein n=1 Tax=Micromonospora sp. GCM10011542 TaxID=3317337 RepID=UPI003607E91E
MAEIRRFPIKSLLGEQLDSVDIADRGLARDREWAVRDRDGKLGSGKNTRRFRRMPGLLKLRSHGAGPVPTVELPDGGTFAADDPAGHAAVSQALGRHVTIEPETDVPHHDEGPVSVITITTAALRQLATVIGAPVDPSRFRANLLLDVPGVGFPEDDWLDHHLHLGPAVVLRPRALQTRCVMIDMAHGDLPEHRDLLKTVAEHHDMTFGVWATVVRPGRVAVDDILTLTPAVR